MKRLHVCVATAMLLSTAAGIAAHADTISTYKVKQQNGSGNIGTLSVDTTTGVIKNLDISFTLDSVQESFDGSPTSAGADPHQNEYTANFDGNGNVLVLEIPVQSLIDYSPANSASCKSNAVDCDFLANVFEGPETSADHLGSFEGNFALASTSGASSVTPEPSSIGLLGTGLIGVAGVLRRRVHA